MIAPFLDRESSEKDEPFIMKELGAHSLQKSGEFWKREVALLVDQQRGRWEPNVLVYDVVHPSSGNWPAHL